MMLQNMASRKAKYEAAAKQAKDGIRASLASGTLYRIPYVGPIPRIAEECLTWPRYDAGAFSLYNRHGDSMLELTVDEQRSLQIVSLRCKAAECVSLRSKKEKLPGITYNWKKIGSFQRVHYRKLSKKFQTLSMLKR